MSDAFDVTPETEPETTPEPETPETEPETTPEPETPETTPEPEIGYINSAGQWVGP